MNEPSRQRHAPQPPPVMLIACLLILAAVCALSGTLAALWLVGTAARAGAVNGRLAIATGGYLLAGLTAGCVLWALAWVVRRMHASGTAERATLRLGLQPGSGSDSSAAQTPRPQTPDSGALKLLQRIAGELSEINSNLLLTDAQRETKRRKSQKELSRQYVKKIHAAIDAQDFTQAEQLTERLVAEVPDQPGVDGLRTKLEEARAAAYEQGVKAATRQAEDLMSVAQFDQARRVVEQLLGKHPASVEAIALLDRVNREAEAFVSEQRNRLYSEIEHNVTARKWRQAVEAAEKFLQAYPASAEAKLVQAQIGTLRGNARIERVREMRDEIREMLQRKRYAEALHLAEEMVERFSDTAVGEQLRQQLPRLKELAESEGKK